MKFFYRLLQGLLVTIMATLMASCNKEDDITPNPPKQKYDRTVLIYMCAENSLGYYGNQRSDSTEIVKGTNSIKPNDRLLLYIDDQKNPRIYCIEGNKPTPTLVRKWEQNVCTSSKETLQDVLTWMKHYYPSEEYGLVMWSHANGWLPPHRALAKNPATPSTLSWGLDVGDGGSLSSDKSSDGKMGIQMAVEDLATAIQQSGIHTKYIFFDACLMQSLEVAYALRHATDYVIASPIRIAADGANYTSQIKQGLFSPVVEDIVTTYHADVTDPAQADYYSDFGVVFSCIRTAEMENLAHATRTALSLSGIYSADSIPDLEGAQHYQTYSARYYYHPHQYDARIAMKHLLPPAAFTIYDSALQNAITHRMATPRFWSGPSYYSYIDVDLENYCGVAAFIPQQVYTQFAQQCQMGDLNDIFLDTEWSQAAGWHTILLGSGTSK